MSTVIRGKVVVEILHVDWRDSKSTEIFSTRLKSKSIQSKSMRHNGEGQRHQYEYKAHPSVHESLYEVDYSWRYRRLSGGTHHGARKCRNQSLKTHTSSRFWPISTSDTSIEPQFNSVQYDVFVMGISISHEKRLRIKAQRQNRQVE